MVYRLKISRREKKKLLRSKWLIVLAVMLVAALVIWLAWVRPVMRENNIGTFEECAKAGNPIQLSYPEVCATKNGKRFPNLKQQQARQEGLDNEVLTPPSNPALLNLDIEEWGVRVPLTMETFDLSYAYFENGESEYVLFSYKRLIKEGICSGDIGLKLTRMFLQNQPPYTPQKPAATAQVDKAFFYVTTAEKSCYDTNSAQQSALVKQITGDKSLIQATTDLLVKLKATPKE